MWLLLKFWPLDYTRLLPHLPYTQTQLAVFFPRLFHLRHIIHGIQVIQNEPCQGKLGL